MERFRQAPNELYSLNDDPGERKNLIDDVAFADRRKELQARLRTFFANHAEPH